MGADLSYPDLRNIEESISLIEGMPLDVSPSRKVLSDGYRDANVYIVRSREGRRRYTSAAFFSREEADGYVQDHEKPGRGNRLRVISGTIGQLEDGRLRDGRGWLAGSRRFLGDTDVTMAYFYLRENYFKEGDPPLFRR